MSRYTRLGTLGLLVLLLVGGALALGLRRPAEGTSGSETWTCSMHPQVRQAGPGRCPLCGMDLVPANEPTSARGHLEQRAGLVTEPVDYRELFKEVRTVGKLDYNERRVAYLTARIAGRVQRVYADFTGIQVKQDDHLVDLYSPDLLVTVDNLLTALRNQNRALADVARERLRLWGMLPAQIQAIETSGRAPTYLTIHAPLGGTIIEKNVREGQYVKEGDPLYRIADLDPIWLYLDVYEYDLAWVRLGQTVQVAVEAYPGESFHGTVAFIDPFLDDRTRTVKVRVNLKNPERRLKPAMYASAVLRVRLRADGTPEPTGIEGKYLCPMHPEVVRDLAGRCPICDMPLERVPDVLAPRDGHEHCAREPGKVLAVRATAVLDTGRRRLVYRQTAAGNYEPVEVRLGSRAEGKEDAGRPTAFFPVLAGLQADDRVVIRGGFLLDSQRQIEGLPSLLYPQGQTPAALHAEHGSAPKQPAPGPAAHKH